MEFLAATRRARQSGAVSAIRREREKEEKKRERTGTRRTTRYAIVSRVAIIKWTCAFTRDSRLKTGAADAWKRGRAFTGRFGGRRHFLTRRETRSARAGRRNAQQWRRRWRCFLRSPCVKLPREILPSQDVDRFQVSRGG